MHGIQQTTPGVLPVSSFCPPETRGSSQKAVLSRSQPTNGAPATSEPALERAQGGSTADWYPQAGRYNLRSSCFTYPVSPSSVVKSPGCQRPREPRQSAFHIAEISPRSGRVSSITARSLCKEVGVNIRKVCANYSVIFHFDLMVVASSTPSTNILHFIETLEKQSWSRSGIFLSFRVNFNRLDRGGRLEREEILSTWTAQLWRQSNMAVCSFWRE